MLVPNMQTIGKTMVSNHILYDFIGQPQLSHLSRYSVIVLASQYVLSDVEIKALKHYVSEGGNLVVTGETGMNDMDGNRLEDFALSDVLGVHYMGEVKEDRTYIAPADAGQKHFEVNDKKYPLALTGRQVVVRPDPGVQILATITLPYSSSSEIYTFGSAISNPPGYNTDHPAVTINTYGKGRTMYIASALEKETLQPQCKCFASLIRDLYFPRLSTDAPEWLEVIVFNDAVNNCYQLTLNNISDERHLWVRSVHVSLKIPEKVTCIRKVTVEKPVTFEQRDGWVYLITDEFLDFAMFIIEYH